jgi:hypothetical protein
MCRDSAEKTHGSPLNRMGPSRCTIKCIVSYTGSLDIDYFVIYILY